MVSLAHPDDGVTPTKHGVASDKAATARLSCGHAVFAHERVPVQAGVPFTDVGVDPQAIVVARACAVARLSVLKRVAGD